MYYQRGDYKRAVEQLERAVELAGDDPTIVEHLGDAYQRLGQSTRDALRVYRDALERAKETAQIERLKGKIQALGGTTERERRPSAEAGRSARTWRARWSLAARGLRDAAPPSLRRSRPVSPPRPARTVWPRAARRSRRCARGPG